MDPVNPPEIPENPELQSPGDALSTVTEKVVGWGEEFVVMLPNIAVALIVVVLGWLLSKLVARLVRSGLSKMYDHSQLVNLAAIVAKTVVMVCGMFLALSVLELDRTVASLVAGVGVVGLALGFAFQDIAANFMSGILLVSRRPFVAGDWVELAGKEGIVQAIDLRSVTIRRFSGELVELPNKDVFQSAMTNFDRSGVQRVEVPVGVGYDSDLEQVRDVAMEALSPHHQCDAKSIDAHVVAFGGSSIDMVLRFWIPSDDEKGLMLRRTEAMISVKQAFDSAGIDIPYPIRTLMSDGGLRLQMEQDAEPLAAK